MNMHDVCDYNKWHEAANQRRCCCNRRGDNCSDDVVYYVFTVCNSYDYCQVSGVNDNGIYRLFSCIYRIVGWANNRLKVGSVLFLPVNFRVVFHFPSI